MILTIDCSTDDAFICLSDNGQLIDTRTNNSQKNHAGFLHLAIEDLANHQGIKLSALDGIAVVEGPGSYTGVRIAMATAKGLCLSLNKPLITLNGLKLLALACYIETKNNTATYIPIVDARRMEVFTATYNAALDTISPPINYILESNSFEKELSKGTVYFVGNAVAKAKTVLIHENIIFQEQYDIVAAAVQLSFSQFKAGTIADLFLAEPLYIKAFFEG